MRLTVYTDYSIRLLMFVALKKGELATVKEVADAYGISRNHLMKVTYDLGLHGFLETVRGRGGGFRLARAAERIILGDVVRRMEQGFMMVECFSPDTDRCRITGSCRLKGVLHDALDAYLAVLDNYTLADLAEHDPSLSKTLLAG